MVIRSLTWGTHFLLNTGKSSNLRFLPPMAVEVNEMLIGWPLGLENMNMRLRVIDTLQVTESNSFRLRSASFSSFTSSDLDTPSTRSFFPDHSITLGRLIGIKPGEGDLYFTNSIHPEELDQASMVNVTSQATKSHEMAVSRGLCIPIILSVFVKINPSYQPKKKKKRSVQVETVQELEVSN
ncbi:uncharacterized protein LOC143861162 [Tasmannia lanceolata]|uniref:uncharacterized protein LOC143861162 n=1 Tax=Tasmannia lanceolata TaxID=3420 RepID=UPI0040635504